MGVRTRTVTAADLTASVYARVSQRPHRIGELEVALGAGFSQVKRELLVLMRGGLVERRGWGRGTFWAAPGVEMPPPTMRTCEGCGGEYEPRRWNRGRFCSLSCANRRPPIQVIAPPPQMAAHVPAQIRVLVIDGAEFETVSVGSAPVTRDWSWNSSLGGDSYAVVGR